jgi:hypothetical protein
MSEVKLRVHYKACARARVCVWGGGLKLKKIIKSDRQDIRWESAKPKQTDNAYSGLKQKIKSKI